MRLSGITFGKACETWATSRVRTLKSSTDPAQGVVDQLTRAAVELASLPTDVIVVHGSPATRAARRATSTIPIVTLGVGDPVRAGFATNLARPDGNITGNTLQAPDLIGKRLEILKEFVPGIARVAFLWNPTMIQILLS